MPIGTPVIIGVGKSEVDDTSVVVTVGPAGVPANATIIVDTVHDGPDDINHSCSDNVNGAYVTEIVPTESRSNINGRRFRKSGSAALVENDQITVSWTGLSDSDVAVAYYFEGADTVSPLSGTPTGQENNNAFPNSGDLTTVDANTIILGFVSRRGEIADGYTEEPGFTTLGVPEEAGGGSGADNRILHIAYKIVSATETVVYSPTLGVGQLWAAGISAYREAPGGQINKIGRAHV